MKQIIISVRSRFGFTLVELMVVISVIGILTSIVYANFGSSRAIARDDIRKTDLKNLQVAIQLYKAQNGRYPSACDDAITFKGNVHGSFKCSVAGDPFIKGLVPDFIAALPADPNASTFGAASNNGYIYKVNVSGTDYKLLAYNTVEVLKIINSTDDFARCPTWTSGNTWCDGPGEEATYAVYSAGAVNW